MIVAIAMITAIISGDPDQVWSETKDYSGISEYDYIDYFKGSNVAFAFKIGTVERLEIPKPMTAIRADGIAPQSYCYLRSSIIDELISK
jgi:predicted transcriptional regulator